MKKTKSLIIVILSILKLLLTIYLLFLGIHAYFQPETVTKTDLILYLIVTSVWFLWDDFARIQEYLKVKIQFQEEEEDLENN